MLIALILLFFVYNKLSKDRIEQYLLAASTWVFYMFITTEILSFFTLFNRLNVVCSWGFLDLFLVIVLYLKYKDHKVTINVRKNLNWKIVCNYKLLGCLLIVAITFVFAIKTVSYNWDSMTYHMSRIAHWAQNQSVAHYATNIKRQVTSPVLAEFVNLHVYVIWGNDILFNLLQWSSYITNAVLVYGIAKILKCKPSLCWLASFLFLTMPIAFAEALSTQNDHFSTMWLLAFVYILLDVIGQEANLQFSKKMITKIVTLSICIAFGYLTKPSVMFGMVIFALWLLIACINRRDNIWILLKMILCSIVIIVLMLSPEIGRNVNTFNFISDPIAGEQQLIGRKNPKYVSLNMYKNLIYNSPNVYFPEISDYLYNSAYKIADKLQIDIDDSSISENGLEFSMRNVRDYNHDAAINPLVFWTAFLAIIGLIIAYKSIKQKKVQMLYVIFSVLSYIVFCAVLRWETYVTRYMLSYLALLCPIIAIQLQIWSEMPKHRKYYHAIIGVILFVCISDLSGMIRYHSAKSNYAPGNRNKGYFIWMDKYDEYNEMCKDIENSNFKNIGLICLETSYEYPLWPMLKDKVGEINHINVENNTNVYEQSSYVPDCIIVLDQDITEDFEYNGKIYDKRIQYDSTTMILF